MRRGLLRRLVTASFRAADRDTFEELLGSGGLEELTADSQLLLGVGRPAGVRALQLGTGRGVCCPARSRHQRRDRGTRLRPCRALRVVSFRSGLSRSGRGAGAVRPLQGPHPARHAGRAGLAGAAGDVGPFYGRVGGDGGRLARRALEGGKIWREQPDSAVPGGATYVLRQVDELDAAERAIVQNRSALRTRKTEAPWAIAAVAYARGQLAYLRGDIARAEPDLRAAVETSRQAETPLAFPDWLAALLEVLIERGRANSGRRARRGRDGRRGPGQLVVRPGAVQPRPPAPRPRQAQEALDDLFALAEVGAKAGVQVPYWPAGSYAALACSALGDQMTARQFAEQELDGARAWGLPRRLGIALRTLGLIEGDEAGLERLREALAVLERSPAKLEYMRTLSDYGALLRRANRRAQARDPLRTAIALARPAGAVAIARRAHGELEATGERLRPLLGAGAESLTPSERRIAEMAAEGQTNRTIAQELFLTLKTVETHLTTPTASSTSAPDESCQRPCSASSSNAEPARRFATSGFAFRKLRAPGLPLPLSRDSSTAPGDESRLLLWTKSGSSRAEFVKRVFVPATRGNPPPVRILAARYRAYLEASPWPRGSSAHRGLMGQLACEPCCAP